MSPDIAPSFGAWLQTIRENRGWTVSEFADRAELPRSTLATLESRARRGSRPRPDVIKSISAAAHVPVLSVAVVAGYFERDVIDVGTDAVFDRIPIVAFRGDFWERQGGSYLRSAREFHGLSRDAAAKRWSDKWSALAMTVEEWEVVEAQGRLPESWDSIIHMTYVNRLPGAWLWALIHAVSGDLAELVGLAFTMARLPAVRCERPWTANADYEQLSRAWNDDRQASNQFNLAPYQSRVRDIAWTIPDVDKLQRRGGKESKRDPYSQLEPGVEDLGREIGGYLAERYPGISGISRDALLATVVRKWGELSPGVKKQIGHILDEESSE